MVALGIHSANLSCGNVQYSALALSVELNSGLLKEVIWYVLNADTKKRQRKENKHVNNVDRQKQERPFHNQIPKPKPKTANG